jgi:hypothetical protein
VQALRDAGVGQGAAPAPDRSRWRVAMLVQQLHDAGCEPAERAWLGGAVQARCPACYDRYNGKRLIVRAGERDAEMSCAIGCTDDAIRVALNRRAGGTA